MEKAASTDRAKEAEVGFFFLIIIINSTHYAFYTAFQSLM